MSGTTGDGTVGVSGPCAVLGRRPRWASGLGAGRLRQRGFGFGFAHAAPPLSRFPSPQQPVLRGRLRHAAGRRCRRATARPAAQFLLHAPRDAGRRTPLVIVLHGLYQSPAVVDERDGSDELQRRPQLHAGLSLSAGPRPGTPERAAATTRPTTSASWSISCITWLALTPVDLHRVYIWGFSNGGMMAWRTVCQTRNVFAGAGVVAGALLVPCPMPVHVVELHGTADRTVPLFGGYSRYTHTVFPDSAAERSKLAPGSTPGATFDQKARAIAGPRRGSAEWIRSMCCGMGSVVFRWRIRRYQPPSEGRAVVWIPPWPTSQKPAGSPPAMRIGRVAPSPSASRPSARCSPGLGIDAGDPAAALAHWRSAPWQRVFAPDHRDSAELSGPVCRCGVRAASEARVDLSLDGEAGLELELPAPSTTSKALGWSDSCRFRRGSRRGITDWWPMTTAPRPPARSSSSPRTSCRCLPSGCGDGWCSSTRCEPPGEWAIMPILPSSPTWSARQGAGLLLVNPLHASRPSRRCRTRPTFRRRAASAHRSTCVPSSCRSTPPPAPQVRAEVDRAGRRCSLW